jgi:membrane-associated phospholipid phosphatase
MSAFATAAVIGAEYPGAAPFGYAAAALTGFSVMKRRWHWPSDVFMGAALGELIGRTSVHVNRNRLSFAPTAKGLAFSGEI